MQQHAEWHRGRAVKIYSYICIAIYICLYVYVYILEGIGEIKKIRASSNVEEKEGARGWELKKILIKRSKKRVREAGCSRLLCGSSQPRAIINADTDRSGRSRSLSVISWNEYHL